MKIRNTIQIFCLISAAVMAGCSLESAREFGDKCDDLAFIWAADKMVLQEDANLDYAINFRQGYCPVNAQFCMVLKGDRVGDVIYPETHYCSDRRESCPEYAQTSYHWHEGNCEADTALHCGKHDNNCLDRRNGTENAKCVPDAAGNMVCAAETCLDSYALVDGKCISAAECCGNYCYDCTRNSQNCFSLGQNIDVMFCGDNCPSFASLTCHGVCINSKTSIAFCGAENCELHYCPDEIDGWRNGICNEGKCQVSDCLFGFHLVKDSGGARHCEPDKPDACGEFRENCTKIEHALNTSCMYGNCIVDECEKGYFAYDDKCLPILEIECGDMKCGQHQKCNTSTNTCECEPGYTECNGVCYDLSSNLYHCGSCNNICHFAHAESACVDGVCTVDQCTGLYSYDDIAQQCVFDSDKCSALGYAYNDESGKCEPCGVGKHFNVDDKICVDDDNAHCGDAVIDCSTLEHGHFVCEKGICLATECETIDGKVYTESPDKTACEERICEPGTQKCDDEDGVGTISICVDNAWEESETCPHGCMDNHSCAECINESRECIDDSQYRYCDSGIWSSAEKCTTTITNATAKCLDRGECVFECNDGYCSNGTGCVVGECNEHSCNSNQTDNGARCCDNVENGTIVIDNSAETCNFMCKSDYHKDNNKCVKNECNNGDTKCTDSGTTGQKQTCSGGVWTSSNCKNKNSCKDDKTCGSCINGRTRCSGVKVQICTNGVWKDEMICEDVSAGVGATAICDDETKRCGYTCGSGYTDNGARCCGAVENGTVLKDNSNICNFTCDPGFCKYQYTCQKSENSVVACGENCLDCTKSLQDATAFSCDNGICRATKCNSITYNYVLYDGQCAFSAHRCDNNQFCFGKDEDGCASSVCTSGDYAPCANKKCDDGSLLYCMRPYGSDELCYHPNFSGAGCLCVK